MVGSIRMLPPYLGDKLADWNLLRQAGGQELGLGAFKDDHAVLRCAYQYLVDHAPEAE